MSQPTSRRQDPDREGPLPMGAHAAPDDHLRALRPYLEAIAARQLPARLRGKFAPSDIVQDVLIEAVIDPSFTFDRPGADLRRILRRRLIHRAIDHVRRFGGKRDAARERSLDSPTAVPAAGRDTTPLTRMARAEDRESESRRMEELDRAIDRLAPDFRRVILLRNRDGLPFAEIGRAMGRTDEAARKLWGRAVDKLKDDLRAVDKLKDDLVTAS